jgi:hypothetical protein
MYRHVFNKYVQGRLQGTDMVVICTWLVITINIYINKHVQINSLMCVYSKKESGGFSHELIEKLMELNK